MCFRDISYRESIAWWQHMNWVICPTQLVMQQEHKLYGSSSTGSPADKKILHPSRRWSLESSKVFYLSFGFPNKCQQLQSRSCDSPSRSLSLAMMIRYYLSWTLQGYICCYSIQQVHIKRHWIILYILGDLDMLSMHNCILGVLYATTLVVPRSFARKRSLISLNEAPWNHWHHWRLKTPMSSIRIQDDVPNT